MGIVFSCLILLYVFFTLFGKYIIASKKEKKEREKISKYPKIVENKFDRNDNETADDVAIAVATLAINEELATYTAVIAMALKQYQDDIHDEESDVITITPHETRWHNSFNNL